MSLVLVSLFHSLIFGRLQTTQLLDVSHLHHYIFSGLAITTPAVQTQKLTRGFKRNKDQVELDNNQTAESFRNANYAT